MKRRFALVLFVAVAAMLIAAACGAKPSAQVKDTFTFALDADAAELNPFTQNDVPSSTVVGLIFDGLTAMDDQANIVPALATEWTPDETGKVWTIKLRQDAKWQDDQPVTADDVVFTYTAIGQANSPYVLAGDWAQRKVEKIGDYEVKITLPATAAAFPLELTTPILPKHIYGNVAPDQWKTDATNRNPVGSGPFKLAKDGWKTGESITLEANPLYFRGEPKLKKVVFRVITDKNAAVNALIAGDVDWAELTPDTLGQVESNSALKVLETPALSYYYIGYNMGKRNGKDVPFFKDKRVRQAIAYAVDKNAVVKAAVEDQGEPIGTPFAPVMWAYPKDFQDFAYDPDRAKQLLDEAGWKVGADGIREKGGVKFAFDLPVRAGKPERERAAQAWAQYLGEVGIKVTVVPEDFQAVLLPRLDPPKFDFDAAFMGWGLSADPDLYQIFHSESIPTVNENGDVVGGSNFISYVNPQVDQLIVEARQELNQERRKELYQQLGQLIADDQPYYFLWSDITSTGVSASLNGPVATPWNSFWNIWTWEFASGK